MKVYALTELDVYYGADPKTIQLFLNQDDALAMMSTMYNEGLKRFETFEEDPENALDLGSGFGDILNGKYRLSVTECEIDLRSYIHDVQELTVVAEEQGVRTKLMEGSKSRPDVWELVQQWTEEFHEKHKNTDWGKDIYFYDEVDKFVEAKKAGLNKPDVELRHDSVVSDFLYLYSKEAFGDNNEHPAKLLVFDGFATGAGIRVEYPKLDELTKEQVEEIDRYLGGRIKESGFVCPDDVCVALGKVTYYSPLMTTDQNHPEDLVRAINNAWLSNPEKFKPILCALYERDIDEITDSDAFRIPAWEEWPEYHHGCNTNDWTAYNDRAFAEMQTDWMSYADNYLMHVADGKDLQCILDFVRG